MVAAYRASTIATTPGAGSSNAAISLTVNKPSGTVDGDFMVAFMLSDPDAADANLHAPTGWAQSGSTQFTTNVSRSKVYVKSASGEPTSYTFTVDDFSSGIVILASASGIDTTTPVNITPTWNSSTTASQTSHIAPSISPTVSGCLMLCAFTSGAASTASYTPPTGMTEMQDAWSGFEFGEAAYQSLAGSGATGTKTATATAGGNGWVAVSMALAPLASSSSRNSAFFPFLS